MIQFKKSLLTGFASLTLAVLFSFPARAQESQSRYWSTIQKFRAADSLQAPPENAILFVGSSSFTRWQKVQDYFPGYTILNRGFGGSQLPDLDVYFQQTVYPKNLKQIVIYSGDNDIASGAVDAAGVLKRLQEVVRLIRKDQPRIPIAVISIKGCPARKRFFPVIQEANGLIKDYAAKEGNMEFIDIYAPTMDAQGNPMPDIYVEDGVHLNAKGYGIWASVIRKYLKK